VRQSNGYSTPAPRSSAAKMWFEQLTPKKERTKLCTIIQLISDHAHMKHVINLHTFAQMAQKQKGPDAEFSLNLHGNVWQSQSVNFHLLSIQNYMPFSISVLLKLVVIN